MDKSNKHMGSKRNEIVCPFCKGNAKLVKKDINLLDGKIILKKEPYYKCNKCKEEFVTSKQMKETEKQINKFYIDRPIISTGRSLAITIPTDIAKFYNLKKGEIAQLIPEDNNTLKIKLK